MPAEGNASVIDRALVHRACDERREFPRLAAGDGPVEGGEHVVAVGGVESARPGRGGKRDVEHGETSRLRRYLPLASVVHEGEVPAEEFCPLREEEAVGYHHQRHRRRVSGQHHRQVRADAGGLTGGQDKGCDGLHSRYPLSPRGDTPRTPGPAIAAATLRTLRPPCGP